MGVQTVQVCKDFERSGACDYSEKCKFAHPPDHVKKIPGAVLVCQDAIRKGCERDNCKHYHPGKGQSLKSGSYVEVCKEFFYQSSGCARENCVYAHPSNDCAMPLYVELCLNFVLGKCDRGGCKFYHDVEGRVDHGVCKDYPRCSRGAECQFTHPKRRESNGDRGRSIDASRNCLDFFHGRCTRDDCRFAHNDTEGNRTVEYRAAPKIEKHKIRADPRNQCLDDFHGRCTRGDECKFVHLTDDLRGVADRDRECLDFFHGRCTRGADCKFAHPRDDIDEVADRNRECLDFFHGRCTRGANCKFSHGEEVRPSKRSKVTERFADPQSQCLDFFHGRCTRERDCRYSHNLTVAEDARTIDPRRECLEFFHNRCTYGRECKYLHTTGSAKVGRGRRTSRHRSRSRRRDRISDLKRDRSRSGRRQLAREVCRDFLIGKCTRDDCRFAHDSSATCPDFKRGYCARGKECLLSHTEQCHDFLNGKCSRGDACRFSH